MQNGFDTLGSRESIGTLAVLASWKGEEPRPTLLWRSRDFSRVVCEILEELVHSKLETFPVTIGDADLFRKLIFVPVPVQPLKDEVASLVSLFNIKE